MSRHSGSVLLPSTARVERARAPLPKGHTDILSHTFSEAVSALSSRSLKMVQIDEYP